MQSVTLSFTADSHDAVIHVYGQAGNVIETHKQTVDIKERWVFGFFSRRAPASVKIAD